LSYQRRPSKPWRVVRKQGRFPVRVVAGERFRTKKKAEEEAGEWNKAYEGNGIDFLVRKEGWRRKRWHS